MGSRRVDPRATRRDACSGSGRRCPSVPQWSPAPDSWLAGWSAATTPAPSHLNTPPLGCVMRHARRALVGTGEFALPHPPRGRRTRIGRFHVRCCKDRAGCSQWLSARPDQEAEARDHDRQHAGRPADRHQSTGAVEAGFGADRQEPGAAEAAAADHRAALRRHEGRGDRHRHLTSRVGELAPPGGRIPRRGAARSPTRTSTTTRTSDEYDEESEDEEAGEDEAEDEAEGDEEPEDEDEEPRTRPTRSPRTRPTRSPRTRPTRSPRTRPTRSPRTRPTRSPRTRPTRSPRTRPRTRRRGARGRGRRGARGRGRRGARGRGTRAAATSPRRGDRVASPPVTATRVAELAAAQEVRRRSQRRRRRRPSKKTARPRRRRRRSPPRRRRRPRRSPRRRRRRRRRRPPRPRRRPRRSPPRPRRRRRRRPHRPRRPPRRRPRRPRRPPRRRPPRPRRRPPRSPVPGGPPARAGRGADHHGKQWIYARHGQAQGRRTAGPEVRRRQGHEHGHRQARRSDRQARGHRRRRPHRQGGREGRQGRGQGRLPVARRPEGRGLRHQGQDHRRWRRQGWRRRQGHQVHQHHRDHRCRRPGQGRLQPVDRVRRVPQLHEEGRERRGAGRQQAHVQGADLPQPPHLGGDDPRAGPRRADRVALQGARRATSTAR